MFIQTFALTVISSNTVYNITVRRKLFSTPFVPSCSRDFNPGQVGWLSVAHQ